MCLCLLVYKVHPSYPLIVGFNRDEYFSRPTESAQFWNDVNSAKKIWGGRDLEAGGTWMGIAPEKKKWGLLTNIRHISYQLFTSTTSRGNIVPSYLQGTQTPEEFISSLSSSSLSYRGFNLVLGHHSDIYYAYQHMREFRYHKLLPGIYSISNNIMLEEPWFRSKRIKHLFVPFMKNESIDISQLFSIFLDGVFCAKEDVQSTGFDLSLEYERSPVCIYTPNYGTRSTTIILIDKEQTFYAEERIVTEQGMKHTKGAKLLSH